MNKIYKCYFCSHNISYKALTGYYVCNQCPLKLKLYMKDPPYWHWIWLRVLFNNKLYEVIWNFGIENEQLSIDIMSFSPDKNIISLKEGINNITPKNIKEKLATILTFM